MLFTIGYGNDLSVTRLQEQMRERGIIRVIDIRSKPYSRYMPQFNKNHLSSDFKGFGLSYIWKGDVLGGLDCNIEDETLINLSKVASKNNTLIMCSERDFNKCHRHYEIARRLFAMEFKTFHITKDNRSVLAAFPVEPTSIQTGLF